jgi:hypothetical protein
MERRLPKVYLRGGEGERCEPQRLEQFAKNVHGEEELVDTSGLGPWR